MKRTKEFILNNKYGFILALSVIALFVLPMCFAFIYTGHDYSFHLQRIQCIADNIAHGDWFSPIYYSHLDGYGYASPLFYGDVFLHIPGFLRYLGMDLAETLKVFIMILFASAAASSYFCGRKIFKNDLSAAVFSAVFTFSSYFCVNIMSRTALGEIQAYVFLPIIALGIYSLVNEDGRHWLCLPTGLFLAVISHVLTAVIAVVCLAVYCLINITKLWKNKLRFALIGISAGVFFLLSAFFVFPLIEQLASYDFAITNGTASVQWGTLADRAMPWWTSVYDFTISDGIRSASDGWLPNGIGLSVFVTLGGLICLYIKNKISGKTAFAFAFTGIFALYLTTDAFPWDAFQSIVGSLQFPWRLLAVATVIFALAAGFAVSRAKSKIFVTVFASLVILTSLFSFINTGLDPYKRMNLKYEQNAVTSDGYINTIGAGEYIPAEYDSTKETWKKASSTKSAVLKRGDKVTSNNLDSESMTLVRGFDYLTVTFENNDKSETYIDVPLIMYKGYTAEIDGEKLEIGYGEHNTVRVYLGNAESGTVTVRYESTPLRVASVIVSIISIIALPVYIVFRKKKVPFSTDVTD